MSTPAAMTLAAQPRRALLRMEERVDSATTPTWPKATAVDKDGALATAARLSARATSRRSPTAAAASSSAQRSTVNRTWRWTGRSSGNTLGSKIGESDEAVMMTVEMRALVSQQHTSFLDIEGAQHARRDHDATWPPRKHKGRRCHLRDHLQLPRILQGRPMLALFVQLSQHPDAHENEWTPRGQPERHRHVVVVDAEVMAPPRVRREPRMLHRERECKEDQCPHHGERDHEGKARQNPGR